jgi:pimeloyl-ACP methyl ester carboxylesterase
MPKVQVNDIEMYYEVHGEGTPLLMLHGFGGASQVWIPYIEEYQQHFQLIIPDYRGHGQTTNPSKEFTARQAADDMFKLLDHLDISKVKGLGCSTGGDILLHMATKKPESVESMAVDGAVPYFPQQARKLMAVWSPTKEHKEIFQQIHHFGDEQINLIVEQMNGFSESYDDMNFTKPFLSTIKAKTLILLGDRDKYYPVEMATILYESIPDSYLWIVPNAGHALTYNNVKQVKDTILDFLTGKWEV